MIDFHQPFDGRCRFCLARAEAGIQGIFWCLPCKVSWAVATVDDRGCPLTNQDRLLWVGVADLTAERWMEGLGVGWIYPYGIDFSKQGQGQNQSFMGGTEHLWRMNLVELRRAL